MTKSTLTFDLNHNVFCVLYSTCITTADHMKINMFNSKRQIIWSQTYPMCFFLFSNVTSFDSFSIFTLSLSCVGADAVNKSFSVIAPRSPLLLL